LFVAAARGRGPATEVLAARQGVVPGASTAAAGGVHGFPAPLTSFIGRAGAVHEVMGLLEQYRLVTVTGPGGVGKTRLAGEVAGQVAAGSRTGCGWQSWRRCRIRRRCRWSWLLSRAAIPAKPGPRRRRLRDLRR